MSSLPCTVRRMRCSDLDRALVWAREEGWNPGLHDLDSFYAADPQGFFVCEAEGECVGSISAVAYDETYGFMGFYIVRTPFRGKGYGMALWNAALRYLGNRCIGADGVPAMLSKYETQGFRIAYRNIRFGGAGGGKTVDGFAGLDAVSFDALNAYDAKHVPVPRREFLRHWVRQPSAVLRVAVDGNEIAGYGMARPCRNAWKIGPLFAENVETAGALFAALCAHVPESDTVLFDVPEPNTNALALAAAREMRPVFETSRIYKGAAPALDLNTIYGVTSFELG